MQHPTELKTQFYNSFDASLVNGFLAKIAGMNETERRSMKGFLGEGTHFQSFEIAANPIPLAVNVAKESFVRRGQKAIDKWQRAIEIARSLDDATLVPPMDISYGHGLMAVVMPKGRLPEKTGSKLIDSMLLDTSRALGQAGLALDDYPQIREAMGVPFIVDWSDLSFV